LDQQLGDAGEIPEEQKQPEKGGPIETFRRRLLRLNIAIQRPATKIIQRSQTDITHAA
jgi:hypothetical protein